MSEQNQRPAANGSPAPTVAHVVQNLDIGGLERIVIDLVKNTDGGRFRSIVYCLGDGGALAGELREAGFPVIALNKPDGLHYFLPFRLSKMMKRESVKVVHCHNFASLFYGAIAGRIAGLKVVYTSHGVTASSGPNRLLFKYFDLVDKALGVSEDTRRLLVETGGFKDHKTETLINGIDVDAFNRPIDRAEKKSEIGISDDRFTFGIVARLVPEKDHYNLLEALSLVCRSQVAVSLVIVGDGVLRPELEKQVRALELESQVRFLGDRLDVPQLLQVFDGFVLSSRTEGLSVTLLEAMAAGLPIVATSVGGNPEVIVDGQTGLLVPARSPDRLAEGMRWLAEHRAEAGQMGERGRQRVRERFSVWAMANRYQEIYDSLLG